MSIRLALGVLTMAIFTAHAEEVSFPAQDGGVIYADLYGTGVHCVVLAHGCDSTRRVGNRRQFSWRMRVSE